MPVSLRFLVLDWTAPHRRLRTAVVAHGSKSSWLLLPHKLRVAVGYGVADMPMPLASFRDSIATGPERQDRADQDHEPAPRNIGDHAGHTELQRKPAHTYWPDH